MHEHWAIDPKNPEDRDKDTLTSITVVVREAAWDDDSRARALALTEYEDNLCRCGCGRSVTETLRKDQWYRVHTIRCAAGRAIARRRRRDSEKNEGKPGWDDGLHYYAEPAESPDADETQNPTNPPD